MSLSVGSQRQAVSSWTFARNGLQDAAAKDRRSDGTPQAFAVRHESMGGDGGPSAMLLAREQAARSFWEVRALEVIEAVGSAAAPPGLNEQERYDFYAATSEGQAILAVEGDLYSSNENTRALLVARTQYLRAEGGAELFNDLTPRRAGLSGEALATYDAEVEQVMNELRTEAYYTEGGAAHPDAEPDESLLYVLAAQVVETHGGDTERLDTLLGDVNDWILSIDNADGVSAGGGTSAGWYSGNGETATMQLSLRSFVNQFSDPDGYYDTLTHELAHALDITDGSADGVPIGMTAADATILREERARLFELAYPGQVLDTSRQQDTSTIVDNSGLTDYGFTNEREFWAEATELFLGSDRGREELLAASPDIYDVLRRYYDRPDLPAAAGETELDDPTLLGSHAASGEYRDIDGALFIDGPNVFDVNQGQIADCYFLAGLASLAHGNPETLRDMITDNGDGTYTVHFGGEAGDVTIDDDFPVDSRGRPLYAGTGEADNPELWVAVIEKAYAQTQGGYEDIEYGRANEAIAEITGHDDFTLGAPSTFTPEQIRTAIAEGRSVTVSSYSGAIGDKKRTENGIVSNHAYVVLGVRERNGMTEVQVYNPWGHTEAGNDGNDDGAFWMSLEDFNTSFREVQMMDTPLPEAA